MRLLREVTWGPCHCRFPSLNQIMHPRILLPLVLFSSLAAAPDAPAQTILRTYNGVDPLFEDHFGAAVCALNDVDSDGFEDYAISAPSYFGSSEVHVYSGRTGLELYRAHGGIGVTPIGRQLANVGDMNHDGVDDFAASAKDYDPCYCLLAVRVFSGLDGSTLFDVFGETIFDDSNDDGFGSSMAGIGDANGDGTPDLAVCAPHQDNGTSTGKIFVYSGNGGSLLWSTEGDPIPEFLGFEELQPMGDVNGDTYSDFSVTIRRFDQSPGGTLVGGWRVYSGFDGATLLSSTGNAGRTIQYVVPLGMDADGDGQDDLVVQGKTTPTQAYLAITSISDLQTSILQQPVPLGSIGFANCQTDLSGDGVVDIVSYSNSSVQVHSGADLHVVQQVTGLISPQYGASVGAVSVIGDVNQDGQSDLLIGSILATTIHNGGAMVVSGGDRLGSEYCHSAVPNSSGQAAAIHAVGSNDPTHNWLSLQASDLPPAQFGIFITSQDSGFTINPGGSLGHLCLTGSIGRFNTASQLQLSDAGGQAAMEVDLGNVPQPLGPVSVQTGQTWHFQMWYRDIGGTSNFTNAVSIDWN